MRTALVLLLLVAMASAIRSSTPRVRNSPRAVAEYIVEHGWLGRFYLRAEALLRGVYGSWWFDLLLGLLVVLAGHPSALAGAPAAVRQRPVQARRLDAFPLYREVDVAAAPADAAAAARGVLRRRGYRVAADGPSCRPPRKAPCARSGAWSSTRHPDVLLGAVIEGRGPAAAGAPRMMEQETWTRAPRSKTTTRSTCGPAGMRRRLRRPWGPGSSVYDDDFDPTGLPTRFRIDGGPAEFAGHRDGDRGDLRASSR